MSIGEVGSDHCDVLLEEIRTEIRELSNDRSCPRGLASKFVLLAVPLRGQYGV